MNTLLNWDLILVFKGYEEKVSQITIVKKNTG